MEFIKNNYKKIIFSMIYIGLAIYMLRYTIGFFNDAGSFNSRGFKMLIIGFIFVIGITMTVLIKFNKSGIEKQFLVIALAWGILFSFMNPPYQVPDEVVHINRAYDLAKGRPFFKAHEDSMLLPAGLKEYDIKICDNINKHGIGNYVTIMDTPLEKDRLLKYNADATGAYNFIAYIPQSIGIFLGDLLNLPTYFVLVLGRLTNLAVWIILCYFALKYIPIRKEFLFILMFLPVGIQQAASFSPDASLNSASFLLISYILYLKFDKEKITYKDILLILGLTVMIASVKIPYIGIVGLFILIPNRKIKFKLWGKILVLLLVIFINLSVAASWKVLSKQRVSEPTSQAIVEVESNESEKVNWVNEIVSNPQMFIEKVKDTVETNEVFYKKSFTAYLGWFRVMPPDRFVSILVMVLLLFAIKGDESKHVLGIFDRAIFALMTICFFILLCAVSFQWLGVRLTEVESFSGLQGRYFYPFIIGIYIVLQNNILKVKNSGVWINPLRNLYVSWTLMFSLAMIIQNYFVPIF